MSALSFGAPLALLALLALPVIWLLLRVTPPAPTRTRFFGLRFLQGLRSEEETPDKTPLWLLILRLVAAALIVLGLSEPVLNAVRTLTASDGVLVLVVDDSWAAAHRWEDRRAEIRSVIEDARRADVPVLLAPTTATDFDIRIEDPSDALARAMALEPQPLRPDRPAMLRKVRDAIGNREGRVVWLTDGIGDTTTAAALSDLLRIGETDVFSDSDLAPAIAVLPPISDATGMTVPLRRAGGGPTAEGQIQAFGENGRFIAMAPYAFGPGDTATEARLELPSALRNDVELLRLDNRASAGSVTLLDESSRRRPVGLVSGDDGTSGQPLLSSTYYLERAFENTAEARRGTIGQHLERGISLLVLADVGQVVGSEHDALVSWIEKGGVLVRFAGARLAAGSDDLLPVQLRQTGARALGGALSWEKPQALGSFSGASPFAGLKPASDIEVRRQVLAEPSLELESRTWATLADGTPLVTAVKRGEGWIVLFHITANAEWSSLPLSGLFVDMLKRLVTLGRGVGTAQASAAPTNLAPRLVLDGYGRLVAPSGGILPVENAAAAASSRTPPGLYGEGPATIALNLFRTDDRLVPFPPLPAGANAKSYGVHAEIGLKPWLLVAALVLFFVDAIASLLLRGYGTGWRRPTATAAILAIAFLALPPPPASAQDPSADSVALRAALQTHLAYVETGDSEIDQISRTGLEGLTRVLNNRTAVTAAEPMNVNLDRDELAFFPLIYWAIPDTGEMPSDTAIARIDAYMKNGGTVIFDSRDGQEGGAASERLQQILRRLDLPPLQKVPRDHVLTKAFYLMSVFPGRQADTELWVEALRNDAGASETVGDGVSSIIVGGGDWAAAWASDQYGRPLYAMGAGGERQREYAYRFGVNLVMYALTGNYKADQVHVPALLERMGQ